MLQIYVTLLGRWFVYVCVLLLIYLVLLSHFLPFKIHLTNISPILFLIKMVDFKNLAWATSFATWASRKFIYLPYSASGKKSFCHTLFSVLVFAEIQHNAQMAKIVAILVTVCSVCVCAHVPTRAHEEYKLQYHDYS